ncbi:MAG: DUF3106 domain-containing protein [Planctomycetota bacterium]|nr:DUF3106 domain-containing protein [Planctomycetota bacterium]
MGCSLFRLKMLALTILVLGGIASAEDPKNPLEERVKRFKSMSNEEKQALRERWKRLQAMSPEEKQALRERIALLKSQSSKSNPYNAQRQRFAQMKGSKRREYKRKHEKMRRMMRRMMNNLPEAEKAQLSKLSPKKRHEAMRGMFKQQILERRLSRLPEPLQERLAAHISQKSFSKSLETLRQAHKEYGEVAQKYFAKLRKRHGKQLFAIAEQSRRRRESPAQLTKRYEDFLARVSPKLSKDRRAILAYMLTHPKRSGRHSPGRTKPGRGKGDSGKGPGKSGPRRGMGRRGKGSKEGPSTPGNNRRQK